MERDLHLPRVASLNVGGKKFCTSRASLTKARVPVVEHTVLRLDGTQRLRLADDGRSKWNAGVVTCISSHALRGQSSSQTLAEWTCLTHGYI